MGPPAWLYYLFGVLMLAVAAYGVLLFALSLASHRRAGRDIDVPHALMGVAMAGMFVPAWALRCRPASGSSSSACSWSGSSWGASSRSSGSACTCPTPSSMRP